MRRFCKKSFIKCILAIGVLTLVFVLGINFYVKGSTKDDISEYAFKSEGDCSILVLGAGLFGDKPSPMLKDRLDKAFRVYNNIKSNNVANTSRRITIIVSGDHGTKEYDEVTVMKKYLVQKGVPSSDIFMDHAGFSSYDSIYRAKEIFGAKNIVIVTQKYHLYRCLYIAKSLGISAYGEPAEDISYVGDTYREIREIIARNKDFIKCIFKPLPKFLGEKISLDGYGDVTDDGVEF